MKCNDVKNFLSQIAGKLISTQIPQADLDMLSSNGFISYFTGEDFGRFYDEYSNLAKMSAELQNKIAELRNAEAFMERQGSVTHSIFSAFEGKEHKEAELKSLEREREVISKNRADIARMQSEISALIQKKSMMDRMVPYDGKYLSLTGSGVIMLKDLNVRNYRVSDSPFLDYVEESKETSGELRSIAERSSFHESRLLTQYPQEDISQLWSTAIGLAKLKGDQSQINQRFFLALDALRDFKSKMDNKMMAAEVMTSYGAGSSPSSTTADPAAISQVSEHLAKIDDMVRRQASVPKELSAGIAAIIMSGRKYDGTFPTDRFINFTKVTSSYESAAILSVLNVPSDQLTSKLQSYRSLFSSWGYTVSEDTELASAYLAISDLDPDGIRTKMTIILDALKNYLEYPIVASAILSSVPILEANETLDLMEKAYSTLISFSPMSYSSGLGRSELISLAVRMIHGVRNEFIKELDPTAKITRTPLQFTYAPSSIFLTYHAPVVVIHSSYHSTFSGIGGAHPAHVHGFGG